MMRKLHSCQIQVSSHLWGRRKGSGMKADEWGSVMLLYKFIECLTSVFTFVCVYVCVTSLD